MWKLVFSSKLHITRLGFKISISEIGVMSEALISPGPFASKTNFFVPSAELLSANDFISVSYTHLPLPPNREV